LRAQFPYYDNTCDFKSKTFDDYCMSIKIGVKHLVAHTILNMIYLNHFRLRLNRSKTFYGKRFQYFRRLVRRKTKSQRKIFDFDRKINR
jgi:hypothetical protein